VVGLARILLAATPLYGHVRPLRQIASALQASGHEVTLLVGTTVHPNTTDRESPSDLSVPAHLATDARARAGRRPRWTQGRDEILNTFVHPLQAQVNTLTTVLRGGGPGRRFDAIVADVSYLGVQPLLLSSTPGSRPPVIGISVTPIMLPSQDCAPFGAALPPWRGRIGRGRNRQTEWLLRKGPLRIVQETLDATAVQWGIGPDRINLFGAITHFDRVFQLGLPELEYPRRELPSFVDFVGPLPATCSCGNRRHPALDVRRPVVHVTQGTLDNADPTKLLLPAIRALANEPVAVVAGTAGARIATASTIGADGRNLHVMDFACYHWLLPRTDLMITNGGYGGVQLAARHGVPLIVAGDTQDKAEVAARVRWSGAGVNLRTGSPGVGRIRNAVRQVLGDRRYEQRAAAVAQAADRLGDPTERIVRGILAAI
jgi:UDP:flavonoid glycosyltransferase YjiC (YdhE family)